MKREKRKKEEGKNTANGASGAIAREQGKEKSEKSSSLFSCIYVYLLSRGWEKLGCIGAVNRQFIGKKGTSDEWHYYISSRSLTAEELLRHARLEWTVETMHWLLDVHFGEDFCRIEDRNVQQNLNIVRKIALNKIKDYKNKTASKRPISKLMFDCLLEPENIRSILAVNEN
jgi:predicted transposase YbfD/YdcC